VRVGVAGMRGAVNFFFLPLSPDDMMEEAEAGVVPWWCRRHAWRWSESESNRASEFTGGRSVDRWMRRRRPSLGRQIGQALPPLEKSRDSFANFTGYHLLGDGAWFVF